MHRIRAAASRILNLFRRERLEDDLGEMVASHAAMLEDEFVRQGMSPREARSVAKRTLGNDVRVRELTRDERFFESLETLYGDIRLAVRRLAERPALTVLSIAALACGIGAAAAAWSLVSAVTLDPLPLVETDRLFVVDRPLRVDTGFGVSTGSRNHAEYLWLAGTGVFDQLGAGSSWGGAASVGGEGAEAVEATLYFVSPGLFETLGVPLALGRAFSEEEDRPGAPLVAILSHAFWRETFDADPEVLGRPILVDERPAVVIGVAPRRFRGIDVAASPDLYLPLHSSGTFDRLTVVGRLPQGMGAEQAEAYLNGLPPDAMPPHLNPAIARRWSLIDINTAALPQPSREGMAQFSSLFGGTVGLLLLIGCLAVGMLLLVRTEGRREEFAMCLALGASRRRLARGVAVEGATLALAGGILALPVAHWLFAAVREFELPGRLPVDVLDLSLDPGALLAATAAAGAAVLIVSLVACSFGVSIDIAHALNAKSGATRRLTGRRLRSALVIVQVAVAVVLLAGTGLFARSIRAALGLNPGYDTERMVVADLLAEDAPSVSRQTEVFTDLRERLGTHPDVESVTVAAHWITLGIGSDNFFLDDEPFRLPSTLALVGVDDEYFTTMGTPLVAGRDFSESDSGNFPQVAIVSESLGRLLAGGGSPLGRRIRFAWDDGDFEVVGVAPDHRGVGNLEPLTFYAPQRQLRVNSLTRTVYVRSGGSDGAPAMRAVRGAVGEMDEEATIRSMRTVHAQILDQMSTQQFGMSVMGTLGGIAVLLTVVGIYVLAESLASGRRRELGIRAALGATRRQLGSVVLVETVRLVGLGVVLGLLLSWAGADMIRAFLFEIEPFDVVTFAGIVALIFILALAVSLRPAINAMRVDPARTLREE